jgi:hypothetical protein
MSTAGANGAARRDSTPDLDAASRGQGGCVLARVVDTVDQWALGATGMQRHLERVDDPARHADGRRPTSDKQPGEQVPGLAQGGGTLSQFLMHAMSAEQV